MTNMNAHNTLRKDKRMSDSTIKAQSTDSKILPNSKRKPPRAGMGRPKGALNKVGSDVRLMVLQALNAAGGIDYLLAQAWKANPAAFLALVGKLIPAKVEADMTVRDENLAQQLNEARQRVAKVRAREDAEQAQEKADAIAAAVAEVRRELTAN